MEEHKILTGMLLVALVVSVVGTVITVDRLGAIGGTTGLTGAVEGTGDLNITQDITITLTDSSIDFGNGKVDPTAGYATVKSNAAPNVDGSWDNITDSIIIRNDGNVGVNVTVQSNKQDGNDTTDSFICQGDVGGCGVGYEDGGQITALKYAYVPAQGAEETGSCVANLAGATPFTVAGADYELCGCLQPADTNDEIQISLQIGIPADAQGQKSSTITFTSALSDVSC